MTKRGWYITMGSLLLGLALLAGLLQPDPVQAEDQTVPQIPMQFLPLVFKPFPPTATPTATNTPPATATPTATATSMATSTPTASETPLPTPPTDVYFNVAVVESCAPNAGVTYVEGTTYVNGTPQSGYLVAFSYAPDGPIVAQILSGPHPGYPYWAPGFYSHILDASGPREGDWYFWIVDNDERRISAIASLHTDGQAGPGQCQQGVIDFDSRADSEATATPTPTFTPTAPAPGDGPDFRMVEQRLWDVEENGGWLDGDSVHCGEKRELHVIVLDAGGSRLNGVAIKGLYTEVVEITGEQGKGDGEVEYVLGAGEDVTVVRGVNGQAVTSDVARGNSTRTYAIPFDQLIQARYCSDDASCQAFADNNGCIGHFSWTVKFQRRW